MISKGPLVIIFHILNYQGLILTFYESWGTETANSANFAHFSFVFEHFAFKTHKTRSLDIFIILMCFSVFSDVLRYRFDQK